MSYIFIVWLLLGLSAAQECELYLSKNSLNIFMNQKTSEKITLILSPPLYAIPDISVEISDKDVASAEIYTNLSTTDEKKSTIQSNVTITGLVLGNTDITFRTNNTLCPFKTMQVSVTRKKGVTDHVFLGSVILLVSILYINFGCAMDWELCRQSLRRPIGVLIGSFCQFIMMPLLAFGIGQLLFPKNTDMQIAIFLTGISPSGGASNMWTLLLGGNLSLSVTMTTISSVASFATIPFWIFTLGKFLLDKGDLKLPYRDIGVISICLIVPLAIGFFIQKKLPRISRIMVRILKPFSVILIIYIVIFAIVNYSYLFTLFSWQIALAGMGLPWLGFIIGLISMVCGRQPQMDIRAIAVETGIQNTGIAILLLNVCLPRSLADRTTVIPVACDIMTPVPLLILWIVKIVVDRRKKGSAASMEKLQGENIPVIITTISTG